MVNCHFAPPFGEYVVVFFQPPFPSKFKYLQLIFDQPNLRFFGFCESFLGWVLPTTTSNTSKKGRAALSFEL